MASAATPVPAPPLPTAPVAPPPPKLRVKKKVRMQEIIIDDHPSKPVDSFRVTISDARAVLRVAEARPVVLSFAFDSVWHCETDVFTDKSVEPVWRFNTRSVRGVDGRDLPEPAAPPQPPGFAPHVSFTYETEFGYKLHRRFLVVTLSERSPFTDVEWGTGVVSIDSIARGCEALDLSIVAKDGVTCYGNVYCKISMTNIQTVRAHLTDLKLTDYPEAYNYDVKLVYLEFGLNGFEHGYRNCTEKRSDAEPRFSAQPALEYQTTLRDMLAASTSHSPALKIFFSVHRQVARNRTEEIGVGALPVRMLFSKVAEGWMDLPTKFKVPLANYKGVIRGKVLLRNIPQFSQLPGSDLVNVDGIIMPQDIDLESRKLLPWVKLPKSREQKPTPRPPGTPVHRRSKQAALAGTVAKGLENHGEPKMGESRRDDVMAKMNMNGGSGKNFHSPVTESASDGGSSSSRAASPVRKQDYSRQPRQATPQHVQNQVAPSDDAAAQSVPSASVPAGAAGNRVVDASHDARAAAEPDGEAAGVVSKLRGRFEAGAAATSHVEQIRMIGALRGANQAESAEAWQDLQAMQVSEGGRRRMGRRQGSDGSGSSRNRTSVVSEEHGEGRDASPGMRGNRSKSGKSVGSVGTADGGVEIGSIVFSDDGYGTGSRTTTEDALIASQRLNAGPPVEHASNGGTAADHAEDVEDATEDDVDSTMAAGAGSGAAIMEDDEEEWVPIHDPSTMRFYFVSQFTQESLWLPPGWERMEDEDGRQYFVDHRSRSTQRGFPAAQARAYRESVYAR